MVRIFSNGVGQAVVADIYEQIEIRAADRIFDDTFCLSGSKTRNTGIDQIGVPCVGAQLRAVQMLMLPFLSPFDDVGVDLIAERLTALQGNDSEFTDRNPVSRLRS